ncbi:cobaltochelatase subunit CobN [Methanobacterium alcaliphilum]|uniref:cobaltochelatase subunit CobN n=1 Tax=Methanobacterium alcaliphilum TaxID=392018 RepID=UPI00200B3844|nr:cobaltochelatase subunit CobN [Methanobacterium alcaliphilum]MCK9151179.1 cobaltochelatase subunit CobN [Methanobacterium alcaliphilum]
MEVKKIRKQVIFILTTFVFIMACCGAVAATDSQGGVNDTQTTESDANENQNQNLNQGTSEPDPRIYGVILNNTTPAHGALINIKNPTNNSLIASGVTNASGEYDIYFNSSLTQFQVEIIFANKNFTSTVTPTGTPIPTAELNYTFVPSQMLKPVKMVTVIGGYGFTPLQKILDAYNELNLEGYEFDLKVFYHADIAFAGAARENFANELKTANIFFMTSGFSSTQPQAFSEITEIIDNNLPTNAALIQTGSHYLGSRNKTTYSYGFSSSYSKETIKKVFLSVLKIGGAIDNSTNTTFVPETSQDLIYHPDASTVFTTFSEYLNWYVSAEKFKPNGAWIGYVFDCSFYNTEDLQVMNAIIYNLESKGINIIPLSQSTPLSHSGNNNFTIYRNVFTLDGTPLISALIIQSHSSGVPTSIAMYKELNVPVIGAMMIGQTTLQDYLNNSMGITGGYELNLWTIGPEIAGRVGNVLVGGLNITSVDPVTGMEIKLFTPYEPGLNQLCDMTIAWANLKTKNNADKKLALVYIDNTHDETMPSAAGLNLPESISNILNALKDSGYDLGSNNSLNASDILALINDHGRNLLNYTQSDLLTLIQKGAITVSKTEYLQWYNQLSNSLKAQVESVWGPAPGNLMVYGDKIVIPAVMLGNVLLAPQPIWKWDGSLSRLYGDENLPPTHQYIAFYLYLQNKFQADAYVQLGDHGTLELLPGHSLGMTADDWPNTLIGAMPHIYIRNMAGEDATASKRRAYALIITHLVPAVTETLLYGNLQELHDLVTSFDDAYQRNDTERMSILKTQIWNKINNETGLSERLGINSATGFGVVLTKLHDYLHTLQQQLTYYGLHTFGELPDNDTLEKFIDAIISFDPATRTSQRDEIRNLLIQSASNEMNALLNALCGGYIEPCSAGDPVRSLANLPSGRNKYTFDPRKVPDSAAMIIAANSTASLLQRYMDSHGNNTYPETIAVPVSGGEVMLTYGQSIASIFYLLGVEPVYNSGMVVGVKVIPLSEMGGRPRIDVLIQASSSLRDACPDVVKLLDEAIGKVAILNESTSQNYVRKHYLELIPLLEAEFKSQGKTDAEAKTLAERLARARIFGLPPGADPHGVGVARLMNSDSWTEEELAETYLDYNSYVYGDGLDGISGMPGRLIMEKLLATVDATMAISPSAISGNHRYFGSATINSVVKYITGKNITSYIVLTGDGSSRVLTIQESMHDDLSLTLFNPVWREGMLKEGYSGLTTIALRIRSIFRTDAMMDVISSATWQKIANTYLFDKNMFSLFSSDQQNMIANTIYQAYKRGMVKLTDSQAKMLAKIMGVEGTESDPGNPSTPSTPSKPSSPSSPGAPSGPSGPSGSSSSPGTSVSTYSSVSAQSVDSSEAAAEAGDASSQKAYEVSKTDNSSSKDDYNYAYAIVGLCSLMGLIGFGYFKGIGRN